MRAPPVEVLEAVTGHLEAVQALRAVRGIHAIHRPIITNFTPMHRSYPQGRWALRSGEVYVEPMMTDEQAAMIAAATALQNSELATSVTRPDKTIDLADAIENLGTQIYVQLRQWNDGREHDELQDQTQMNAEKLKRHR